MGSKTVTNTTHRPFVYSPRPMKDDASIIPPGESVCAEVYPELAKALEEHNVKEHPRKTTADLWASTGPQKPLKLKDIQELYDGMEK